MSEKVLRRALAILLRERAHTVIEEQQAFVVFHGQTIGTFSFDLLVDGCVLAEIKAGRQIEPRDEAQTLNYLKVAGGGVGLLINFGYQVRHKRFVMGDPRADLPNVVRTPGVVL